MVKRKRKKVAPWNKNLMPYKKSTIAYSWDRPVERIKSERGITLYAEKQYDDSSHTAYPRYKYKVTFKLIKQCKLKRGRKW